MTPADLAELLKTTAAAVLAEHGLDTSALPATVTVERPRNPEHGDYATNLALQLGKKVGANPRELAGWLATALMPADGIAAADVAGPGFVNLRIAASAQGVIVDNVIDAGRNYGHSDALDGQNINLEFVSANPTGPIHIGGTRWAAVGDALGRLLSTQGAECRARVLLQRPRRADRPVHQLVDRRREGRADARRRLRRRLHQGHRRPGARQRRPTH